MQLRGEGQGKVVAESIAGGIEAIAGVEGEWRSLCVSATWDEPFFRPEWVRTHLQAFEPEARLRLVVARRDGRLVALLPLVEEVARWKGIPFRRLRGAAGVHSCRFDLLLAEGEEEEATAAIWEHLRSIPGWHVIEVRDVPFGGGMERLLQVAERDGNPVGTWESMRTPFITLPDAWEIKAKFRANLRRRRKRLVEKGDLGFFHDATANPERLAQFYRLESAGWKGSQGTAILRDPRTRIFYDLAAAWAEREGMFSLYGLELRGKPIAMHWGLTHKGRYFLPKPAYDETFATSSPGQLLVEDVVEDCRTKGLDEFDFLGPWMNWKADWTDQVRPHRWCFIYGSNPLGKALFTAKLRIGPWLARRKEARR